MTHRAGTLALVGRPNTGKSSLVNRLLGRKISIVSPRAQTTRQRVYGLLTEPEFQIVFVDTPGVQDRYRASEHQRMNREALIATHDVDVILLVVEAGRWTSHDAMMLSKFPEKANVILVANKVDLLADKSMLLPYLAQVRARYEFSALLPVSAQNGHNLDALVATCVGMLPEQPAFYDANTFTQQQASAVWMTELIREQIYRSLGQELPYGVEIQLESDEMRHRTRHVSASLYVARAGQKALVIGRGGERLKKIGTLARGEMEKSTGQKIYLELWVKVKPKTMHSLL